MAGAPQKFWLFNSNPDDAVGWTIGDCYTDITDTPTHTSTKQGLRSITYYGNQPEPFYMHSAPLPAGGTWQLCFKLAPLPGARSGGTWTPVYGAYLTMWVKPTFAPPVGVAGHQTVVTFQGSKDGDYFVMQEDNCQNAHVRITSEKSLGLCQGEVCWGKRNIHTTFLPWYNVTVVYTRPSIKSSRLLTEDIMTKVTNLVICYAAYETDGDEERDYSQLDGYFHQAATPDFTPKRTVTGAPQKQFVLGAVTGDRVSWNMMGACNETYVGQNVSGRRSAVYTLAQDEKEFALEGSQLPGMWHFCYQPRWHSFHDMPCDHFLRCRCKGRACMSQGDGLWTLITRSVGEFPPVQTKLLTVIAQPRFSPQVGLAGSVTPISFRGTMDTDFVVLKRDHCGNSHLVEVTQHLA